MNNSDQTLLEQMQITEHEIKRRKELVRLGAEEAALLSECRPMIEHDIDAIIEEFLQMQIADEDIALFVGSYENLRRLHAGQRQYIIDLFSGRTDTDYVTDRLRIGLAHKRCGVEPKLYVSAMKMLRDIMFKSLERRIEDRSLFLRTCQALDKILYFDIILVFDTYTRSLLSDVESAKGRLEVYAASLEVQVSERTKKLQEKVHELEAALAVVKKLEGVIPICGVCKKIRGDKESWEQVEQYISEHSQALFSHGLCPDCYEKEMMGVKALKEGKGAKKNGSCP